MIWGSTVLRITTGRGGKNRRAKKTYIRLSYATPISNLSTTILLLIVLLSGIAFPLLGGTMGLTLSLGVGMDTSADRLRAMMSPDQQAQLDRVLLSLRDTLYRLEDSPNEEDEDAA